MSKDELIETLQSQHAHLEVEEGKKKNSQYLKEMRSEINDFRKDWGKKNPESLDEIARLKEEVKAIESVRDADIESDLQEKKDLEGTLNDCINGAKEHITSLVFCLRFN